MTNKKKLIGIGVAVSAIVAIFVLNIDSTQNTSLKSSSITEPTCDTQTTKVFTMAALGDKVEQITGAAYPYSSKNTFRVGNDQDTRNEVCQKLGYDSSSAETHESFSSPGDNRVLVWDGGTHKFIYTAIARYTKDLTCTRLADVCIADQCTNIDGKQLTVPDNLKGNSTTGICSCINEGEIGTIDNNVATCTRQCNGAIPIQPTFEVTYESGYPKLYDSTTDTTPSPVSEKRVILSTGALFNLGDVIPLFRNNDNPFYNPDLLYEKPQLSLQRDGNKLRVLWYGNRTDGKVLRVKGRIEIHGGDNTQWTSIVDKALDTEGTTMPSQDSVTISTDGKYIIFDLSVRSKNDVFFARYDIGTGENAGCSEVPKPTAVTAICSADKSKVTVSWTNAPGYNAVYFRAVDRELYPEGSTDPAIKTLWNDNYIGNTKTFNVTPNHQYDWWIHTWANEGTDKYYSKSVGGSITCLTTHTITYRDQDAIINTLNNVTYGTKLTAPTDLNDNTGVKTFAGWYKESSLINAWNFSTDTVTGDMILYAKWAMNARTVTFNTNGGSVVDAVKTEYNTTIAVPINPRKTGYDFAGWYKESSLTNVWDFATDKVTENTTLYAKWTQSVYTLSANAGANGSITPTTQTANYGTRATFTINPSTGYTIADVTGCNRDNGTLSGTTYTTGPITTPCTVNATFVPKTYTLSANAGANGSITPTNPTTGIVNYNATATFTVTPNDGYSIASVTGCGGTLSGTTYTTGPITAFCAINATFSLNAAPEEVVDNDCDGVNDAWETQYGYSTTDNTVPSDTADTDGDSHSDKNEGLFGTNPKSGAAPFPGSYTPTVSGTTVTISFPSYLGNIYSLQKSSDLSNYADIATNIIGTGSSLSRTTPKTATSEFYRVLAHALTCSKTPITSLGAVTGIAQVGQTLTAGMIVPSTATVTYRWQRADTSAGTYTDITSATQNTYTLTIADQGKYIRVIVTGTGAYTSTLTSASVGPVAAATDSTAPTAVRVSSSLVNGTYRSGTIIPISVEFSAPVTVTGIPTLLLETGTNDVMAIFKQTENDSKTLIFEYLVSDGDTSLDLNYVATDALKLPDTTTTIKSATTGLTVNRILPALTADTSLAGNKAIVIDTTRPAAPARPIVPEQTNITLSSTSAHTYVANSSIMKIKVACTLEETIKIYNGVSFSPLATAKCTANPMEITLDLLSQADYHNIFATVTDIAGNESDYSPRIVILKPQTHDSAPSVPDLDALHDLGKSSTDNFTSVTQPLFTLMCTSGATVNLYDGIGTAPIGASPCVASTAQIMPAQPLSAGMHTLTAKQIINGTTSATSSPLSVTIDTTPLTVSLSKASSQIEPATSTTIQFTATFSRAIDPNSFVCSDITVVNGTCNTITAVSSTVYTLTVIATNQGQVKVTIYPGRVQTDAGNPNTESTGANTVTYGTATAAQCSNLRRYTTSNPRSSSLNGEDLCLYGTPSNVSYNSSNLKWTYQCRGSDGSTDSCTVSAILNAAPKSVCEDGTEKDPVDLQFDQCSLTNTSNLFYFYKYLSCLGVVPEKSSCTTAQCGDEAKRQELIRVADILRGIPLDGDYTCQGNHTDTKKGVASWVCEAAEKGQIAGLISKTNTKFRPLDTMTRAEAYSVLLKSVCVHPDTTYLNWQTKVAQTAKELGFTVRSVSTFESNKLILRQELYALAARIAQYKEENPDTCDDLPGELICEE